ncbi:hypothetical protein BJX61DRAFT_389569 [Aspergillus egyptiacus]|nr:hypothetical protein BJX61DRAFT_389569 [Aspergillus egyptiacus]
MDLLHKVKDAITGRNSKSKQPSKHVFEDHPHRRLLFQAAARIPLIMVPATALRPAVSAMNMPEMMISPARLATELVTTDRDSKATESGRGLVLTVLVLMDLHPVGIGLVIVRDPHTTIDLRLTDMAPNR